jgi:hypothetical protein
LASSSFSVVAREGGEERARGRIGDCGDAHAGGGEDNGEAAGGGAMTDCGDAHAGGGEDNGEAVGGGGVDG